MKKLIIVLVLNGCCFSPPAPAPETRVAPAVEAPVAEAPPAEQPTIQRRAVAMFLDGRLAACVDDSSWQELPAMELDDTMRALAAPCQESFRDRVVFATCTKVRDERTTVLNYYSHRVLDSDAEMLGCMDLGGEWRALSRDSREYRRARLEDSVEELQRTSRELRGR